MELLNKEKYMLCAPIGSPLFISNSFAHLKLILMFVNKIEI
jgi:hypothetical protein